VFRYHVPAIRLVRRSPTHVLEDRRNAIIVGGIGYCHASHIAVQLRQHGVGEAEDSVLLGDGKAQKSLGVDTRDDTAEQKFEKAVTSLEDITADEGGGYNCR
jgi:hypothetical protein